MNRDNSLLPEVIPMVAEFQTDFNANCRKFVATFLREVVRAHPQHVSLVVPVASYLMHDSSTAVKKNAVLLANTIYRPALQRLVDNGSAEGAQKDWSTLDGLRKVVLNTITSGPADISMVAVKFAESVVLACVGGRGLAPGASREGDKSGTGWGSGFGAQHYTVLINALQNLATNRAALFGDIVPALASALESVNGNGSGRSKVALEARGGGKKGPTAGAIVPKGLRDAGGSLRSACLKLLKVAPGPSVGVQRLAVAAALSGSDGEAKAAVGGNTTLKGRIKLPVRVRERPVVRAAPTVRTLPFSAEDRRTFAELAASVSLGKMPKPPPGYKQNRTKNFPLPDLETLFGHVLNALGPGIASARRPAVPKEEEIVGGSGGGGGENGGGGKAGTKRPRVEGQAGGEDGGGGKRRTVDVSEAAAKSNRDVKPASAMGRSLMDVEADGGAGTGGELAGKNSPDTAVKSELEPAPVVDTGREGLETSKKAFCRVLRLWEGVAMEGKRGLHQRVVARLGRMLAEAEVEVVAAVAAAGRGEKAEKAEASEPEPPKTVVAEVVEFMTKDYRKRFQASLALLTEIYAADVAASATSIAAAAAVAPAVQRGGGRGAEGGGGRGGGGGGAAASAAERGGGRGGGRGNGGGKGGGAGAAERPEGKPRGFKLYDETLLKLLTTLSRSLEASWRQKLFTQTLLECPRVPPTALELVCSLCDMAAQPHDVQTGLVALKDLIFHKPATRGVCIPSVLRFTYHSDNDVRTKAVRLASNLLWPDAAFQGTIEAFAKEALTSVRSLEVARRAERERRERERKAEKEKQERERIAREKERKEREARMEKERKEKEALRKQREAKEKAMRAEKEKLLSARAERNKQLEEDLVDFEGDEEEEEEADEMEEEREEEEEEEKEEEEEEKEEKVMLSGLIEAYVTAAPTAQAGLMAELPLLAKAAAKAFGEPGVVGLMAAAPEGAKTLILMMLDLLVPRETNKPSPELVAAAEPPVDTAGIEYMVPILGGLGREGFLLELPALLQADDNVIRAAFRRLTQPAKGAMYTPAELVVLLNQFDFTAAGVPMKRLTRALSLCLDNKTVYNYPVLREALNVMSQVSPADKDRKALPLLLMRTVMVSVATFPELKNFVATVVLVRLVQLEVWNQPPIWGGFLRCAKMMAKESGATSFIAMVQLPDTRLKQALADPRMKVCF
eukprot:jgi/Undpi1/13326/HiC_scaffold_8.g02985.m1